MYIMNISCCCNNKDMRWFNNGQNVINISSDFIEYQKYTNKSCKSKYNKCYPRAPNQTNSGAYTASLKANIIYPNNCAPCKCVCGTLERADAGGV